MGRADTLCALLAIAATAAALLARGHSFEVTLPGPGELTSIQCAPSQPLAQLLLAALGLLLAAAASLSKETGLTGQSGALMRY